MAATRDYLICDLEEAEAWVDERISEGEERRGWARAALLKPVRLPQVPADDVLDWYQCWDEINQTGLGRLTARSVLRTEYIRVQLASPKRDLPPQAAQMLNSPSVWLPMLLKLKLRKLKSIRGRLGYLKPTGRELPEVRKQPSSSVFVVHGRDERNFRHVVGSFLQKLELQPIILEEQANLGDTVIENVERHSGVGYCVVIWAADDYGALSGEEPAARVRQNVLYELGYFHGKLGRGRVHILHGDVGTEVPSDLAGIIYTRLDHAGGWRQVLARELRAAGVPGKFDLSANG